ncbi:MAG: ClpXP protease specificity-enhancing factor [uncultured bacterium]|nr:MAG: ClpXP protease specificity-enhancing factor [uncultured bacterium]OGT33347.1 MAG: ClpXP protease specificity-enhancing factor [Gammaproteobacteria bacterium RIFCSPHIGHO2_02_FULL_39_13]OGT50288.1 MAG: ClpXP protease specificity-enhancing factor [Gammaproteobacteria bacterium RIFCSPHIGHO2_12_FULL_39_24]
MTPSRPYFLRGLYEWIVDNALTPHVMVDAAHPGVSVPQQYVKDGKIVLNIAPDAILNLAMTNDWVNFDARFSGVKHHIRLPVLSITAIYAVENGRGMVFEKEEGDDDSPNPTPPTTLKLKSRPSLKVVK